jgi:hypothetical protein
MNQRIFPSSNLQVALTMFAGLALAAQASCNNSSGETQVDSGGVDVPACPASCDDKNDCTIDSCDPDTNQCVYDKLADGISCEDGNPCSINDVCKNGLCYAGPYKTCTALDQCHLAGVCTPRTGECTNPNAPDKTTSCDDGDICSVGDQCLEGVCTGALKTCAGQGVCDRNSGSCKDPYGRPIFPAATSGFVIENAFGPLSGNGLARTPDGNVFAAGSFFNRSDFGSGPIATTEPRGVSNTDVFLARLDPLTGRAIWTQTYGGPGKQDVTAFASNGIGQIGIIGPLQGGIVLGETEVDRLLAGDNYILGVSSADSAAPWIRRVNLGSNVGLRAIAGDPKSGNFVLCGIASLAATDLDPRLVQQGGTDIVLAQLRGDDSGKTAWAKQFGGVNNEECNAVAIDSLSNIYLVGTYRFGSTVAIEGLSPLDMIAETGNIAWMFIAKLDPSGKGIWARPYGKGKQTQMATAVMLMPNNGGGEDLVVAGTTTGTSSFNDVALESPDFVAMLDGAKGDVLWVKALGSGGIARASAQALSFNSAGGLLVAGSYSNAVTMGVTELPAPASTRAGFVALMDTKNRGAFITAIGYGNPDNANGAIGVLTNRTGSGEEKDATLFLASFQNQIELGAPAGTLTSSSAQPAIASIRLAP